MRKLWFFYFVTVLTLHAKVLLVITNRNFPTDHVTPKELKAIYLDKKHLIKQQKLLPINYESNHPLRHCFEKQVLKKNRRALERYWLTAHYHGKQPPKVVKSKSMLLAYIKSVNGAIGYIDDNTSLPDDIKIVMKLECP